MATGEGATPAPKPGAKATATAKPAVAKTANAPKAVKAAKVAGPGPECLCGCKGHTKGGTFLPGHDARYHSAQRKAAAKAAAKSDGGSKPPTPPVIAEGVQPEA